MLNLLLLLIAIAVIAGALGFTGLSAGAALLAKIVFFLMLVGIAVVGVMVIFGLAVLF